MTSLALTNWAQNFMTQCISLETSFSEQFSKIATCYKRKGYTIDVIKHSACLAVDPITVDHFTYLFDCTPVGRGSDSMMAPT